MQPALEHRIAGLDLLHQTAVVAAGPVGLGFKSLGALLALGHALAAPFVLFFAQGGAFMGRQGTHYIAVENLAVGICFLEIFDGAGIGLLHGAAHHAVAACLSVGDAWQQQKSERESIELYWYP